MIHIFIRQTVQIVYFKGTYQKVRGIQAIFKSAEVRFDGVRNSPKRRIRSMIQDESGKVEEERALYEKIIERVLSKTLLAKLKDSINDHKCKSEYSNTIRLCC